MLNEDINNAGQHSEQESWHSGTVDNPTHAVRQPLPTLRLISLPNESMQLTVDELKHNAINCKSYNGKGERIRGGKEDPTQPGLRESFNDAKTYMYTKFQIYNTIT